MLTSWPVREVAGLGGRNGVDDDELAKLLKEEQEEWKKTKTLAKNQEL